MLRLIRWLIWGDGHRHKWQDFTWGRRLFVRCEECGKVEEVPYL